MLIANMSAAPGWMAMKVKPSPFSSLASCTVTADGSAESQYGQSWPEPLQDSYCYCAQNRMKWPQVPSIPKATSLTMA